MSGNQKDVGKLAALSVSVTQLKIFLIRSNVVVVANCFGTASAVRDARK